MEKSTEAGTVVVETNLNASPPEVWAALTEKRRMREWYFEVDDFKPEFGFSFSFAGQGSKGEKYIHVCKVTAVQSEHKLQYSWTYQGLPGHSLVTFDMRPWGKGTNLRVRHSGLETFAPNGEDFAKSSFQQGWTEIVTKMLPDYLNKNKE